MSLRAPDDESLGMDDLSIHQLQETADGAWELPEVVLQEIRQRGFYDEVSIDPVDGRVLSRVRVSGSYDSYSNTYVLNGRAWKIESQVNLPGGRTLYHLVLHDEKV